MALRFFVFMVFLAPLQLSWKAFFGDKITWIQYREGFGGSKGVNGRASKIVGILTQKKNRRNLDQKSSES